MTYFQTTPMQGDQLALAIDTASRQDDYILSVYQRAGRALSPSEVHKIGEQEGRHWPIQSVRRSITTLTDAGALVMLDMTRRSPWNRPEHYWALPARDEKVAA